METKSAAQPHSCCGTSYTTGESNREYADMLTSSSECPHARARACGFCNSCPAPGRLTQANVLAAMAGLRMLTLLRPLIKSTLACRNLANAVDAALANNSALYLDQICTGSLDTASTRCAAHCAFLHLSCCLVAATWKIEEALHTSCLSSCVT